MNNISNPNMHTWFDAQLDQKILDSLIWRCSTNFFTFILKILRYKLYIKIDWFYIIRVAQRITRSATNREIAGSNPVTDNDNFLPFFAVGIFCKTFFFWNMQLCSFSDKLEVPSFCFFQFF